MIVGVGGFLGIGEKKVAIPFKALEIQEQGPANMATTDAKRSDRKRTTGESGTVQPDRIVLRSMTKKDLEDAPNFKTSGR